MKNKFLIILLVSLIQGCKTNNGNKITELTQNVTKISFEVKVDSKEGFENDIMPWISIKNPELEIGNLIGKDEIVIKNNVATLIIDYPLGKPVEINIKSKTNTGFKKRELAEIVSREYHRIYKEEEESAKIKTTSLEEREGLINRNQTNGKYAIWGHDIDDLDLSGIIVRKTKGGKLRLELIVES